MKHPEEQYIDGTYASQNPSWDSEDSQWKAAHVCSLIEEVSSKPGSICEVGCGGGGVLAAIHHMLPGVSLSGYDISPGAQPFWEEHDSLKIDFHVGDFLQSDGSHDIILLLDVLEHVSDPHAFLLEIRRRAPLFIFHFPLDLSSVSVLRESPLLHVRRKVGHIHYFTKGLALELLSECGFEVIKSRYTGAAFNTPQPGWKTKLAQIPRRIAYALNKDFGVRLLGGETLMVLAKPR
ncbi:Methyltransferase domain-containing protein [Mariprofundus aestuarium]|uniref:Methyltransferase domain-containing protein n=1 Tax=Mariprofundus aestuarium TaxID=1921086 RepID=A0A2K8KZ54_MARES|nr:methyltransferase domain-containing protein [Mariprofundus aestuarium]ATX80278.1 Methyltransferase domain-containing protein [Mariprofundus aestuarium]